LWNGEGATADEVIDKQGLKQITDSGAIESLVDEVLAANPGNVAEFKAGKEKAFNALVGQVMKAAKGKANPQQVNDLLRQKLSA
jgi:aspartyl-tRNA(Asn)/glutamyl-tRNA(Gln) amidotransferase subunit B